MKLVEYDKKFIKEWNYKKNIISIDQIKYKSSKKVWWICEKGHEWEAIVSTRTRGGGCPYCCGKLVTTDNCLLNIHPILMKEWDYEKNIISPEHISYGSSKKVWWVCEKGHSWQAVIYNRTKLNGTSCPYCSNKKVCKDNCLATTYPHILIYWDFNKNKIIPTEVMPGSSEKVWWKCDKGHSWKASIKDIVRGRRCPYCSNKKVCKDNCLANTNVELLQEWDYDRNKISPYEITAGSHKKVWWICKYNQEHKWKSEIVGRKKHGCPHCCNNISIISQIWLDSLNIKEDNREKLIIIDGQRFFADGFNPKTNTIYEFNGDFWHGNPEIYNKNEIHPILKVSFGELYNKTKIKESILKNNGYKVISIWENDFRRNLK